MTADPCGGLPGPRLDATGWCRLDRANRAVLRRIADSLASASP